MKKILHIATLLLLLSAQAFAQATAEALPTQAADALPTQAATSEALPAEDSTQAADSTRDPYELYVVDVDEVIDPHQKDRYDYVSDMAGVFNAEQEQKVNELCLRAEKEANLEILVVCVPSIGASDPFHYSVDLYQRIGIGLNDRGILILVVVDDHYWEIRTGYGAEGQFPDAVCSYIGRNKMVPEFRNDNYAQGITDAMEYIVDLATSDEAMAQLKADLEAEEAKKKAEELRDDLNMVWGVVAFWCFVAVMAFFSKKDKYTKKQLKDATNERMPQIYSSCKRVGNYWEGTVNPKVSNIDYWKPGDITRYIIYYIGPAIAVGAVSEASQSPDALLGMIPLCNTWVVINYFLARSRTMKNYAETPYQKKLIYEHGYFASKSYIATLLAPWVGIPALLIAAVGKKKYKDAVPPCPKCGAEAHECMDGYDMQSILTDTQKAEMRIGSCSFKVLKCDNGHITIERTENKSEYTECKECGALALKLVDQDVIESPTYNSTGRRKDTYVCACCGTTIVESIVLSKLVRSSSSSRGGGSSSGGGGGSWGGGSTGGGGAGGSW